MTENDATNTESFRPQSQPGISTAPQPEIVTAQPEIVPNTGSLEDRVKVIEGQLRRLFGHPEEAPLEDTATA